MTDAYREFLARKAQVGGDHGFAPMFLPSFLFDFQTYLLDWSLRKGRAAIFADCGMGKTPIQLCWAQNVAERENKHVLILAPLSVVQQTVEEAEKFGISAARSQDGKVRGGPRATVTNYERLHHFDPDQFAGVVCDESSILKSFDGERRSAITEFMRKVKYRLLCTATAAPNDYVELGTSSEALGYLGHMDMLLTFFKNDEDSLHPAFVGSAWRLKRHAERDFWRWMASWARACRRPSDLGFGDGRFVLPELIEVEHDIASPIPSGSLFEMPAETLEDQRADTRRTIGARCDLAAQLLADAPSAIAWCNLNDEADSLAKIIPGAAQVSGSDDDERREELFTAFRRGQVRVLVTKPRIGAFGMNWQHCSRMTYFPTHSYEQYYQAVRRCWRFGQESPVRVDAIATSAQAGVIANMRRKAVACDEMFSRIVAEMSDALKLDRLKVFADEERLPAWL